MNAGWYRTVGTLGVVGGFLLLGGAAAQADATLPAGPQPLAGVLGDLLSPTNGLTGPLGGNPASGLMPGDDVVPGLMPGDDVVPRVVDGPYVVPPPAMEVQPSATTGDTAATDGPAGRVQAGPAASVVSPLAPARGGLPLDLGGLPLDLGDLSRVLGGDLLPAGDLLSGGGVAPVSQVAAQDRVPAVIGDEMTAVRPELFSPGPSLLGGLSLLGGGTPAQTLPATAAMPAGGTAVPAATPTAATKPVTRQPATTHSRPFSDGRPVAGEDPDYR